MDKTIHIDNSRYVLIDLENVYDLPSNIDQARAFINDQTKLSIRDNNVYLFLNMDSKDLTLGIQVVGIPDSMIFDDQDKFYLEDYQEFKVFRSSVGPIDFKKDEASFLVELIEKKASELFESEESWPSVVRLGISNWTTVGKNLEEKLLEVDFFLD